MTERMKKVNKNIQRIFAKILQIQADLPPDVMVTVSTVDTTPNFASTNIWLYVMPEAEADNILNSLQSQIYELQGELNKKLDLKRNPRVRLRIDYGAKHQAKINKILQTIDSEKVGVDQGQDEGR